MKKSDTTAKDAKPVVKPSQVRIGDALKPW